MMLPGARLPKVGIHGYTHEGLSFWSCMACSVLLRAIHSRLDSPRSRSVPPCLVRTRKPPQGAGTLVKRGWITVLWMEIAQGASTWQETPPTFAGMPVGLPRRCCVYMTVRRGGEHGDGRFRAHP